jgi:hypothetical protein
LVIDVRLNASVIIESLVWTITVSNNLSRSSSSFAFDILDGPDHSNGFAIFVF